MPTTITMPQLGETVTEGTVAQWLKNVGDSVEKYEAFVEVSTDKVNAEVPSPVSGTIVQIIAKEGETVPTGAPIAVIAEVGEVAGAAPSAPVPAVHAASLAEAVRQGSDEPVPGGAPGPVERMRRGSRGMGLRSMRPRCCGAFRPRCGGWRGNIASILRRRGSGTGGRITAGDVLAAAAQGPAAAVAAAVASAPVERVGVATPVQRAPAPAAMPGETMPLTRHARSSRSACSNRGELHRMRGRWSKSMRRASGSGGPREKDRFVRDYGVPLTLLPFFIRAVVEVAARVSADELALY